MNEHDLLVTMAYYICLPTYQTSGYETEDTVTPDPEWQALLDELMGESTKTGQGNDENEEQDTGEETEQAQEGGEQEDIGDLIQLLRRQDALAQFRG